MASRVIELTEATFHTEVLGSPLPVLVDFWAPWCAPCSAADPVLEQLAGEFAGKVKVCKLNTSDHPTTGMNYRISSVPTFLLFRGGAVVSQLVGARLQDLRGVVERALE